jgi:hypothetical protein
MGSRPEDETEIPANPVAIRKPLRHQFQAIDPRSEPDATTRKLAENQIAFCTRIDQMDADLVDLGRRMLLGFASVEGKIDTLANASFTMRRREDSTHAIEEMARSVGEAARSKAQQIVDDPHTELTPDVIKDMMQAEMKAALEKQREADRVKKLEADAAKIEEDRRKKEKEDEDKAKDKARERREFKRNTISGIIVGLVILIATAAVAVAQGRALEHDRAYAEGRAAASIITVPVPVPAGSGSVAAPAAPMAAPATVAPGHR